MQALDVLQVLPCWALPAHHDKPRWCEAHHTAEAPCRWEVPHDRALGPAADSGEKGGRQTNKCAVQQGNQDLCTYMKHSVHKPTRAAQQHPRQATRQFAAGFAFQDWPPKAGHMPLAAALLKSPASGTRDSQEGVEVEGVGYKVCEAVHATAAKQHELLLPCHWVDPQAAECTLPGAGAGAGPQHHVAVPWGLV